VSDREPIRFIEAASVLTEPLAEGDADPAGGAVAAVAAALAASLAAAAADRSRDEWDEAAGARAQAQALRRRALVLAREDADAYANARAALAERGGPGDPASRDARIGDAVTVAAQLPLRIGATAADIAQLAGEIASRGNADVRADAAIAAAIAAGAARGAAHLVEINLVAGADEQLVARARRQAQTATDAAGAAARQS
jgi:formiminotetrahydrofolate cyclodeaminase